MKTKKVLFVAFQSAVQAPGLFGGEVTLSVLKHQGIEMTVGEFAGCLTVKWKDHEILVPLMNIKSMVIGK